MRSVFAAWSAVLAASILLTGCTATASAPATGAAASAVSDPDDVPPDDTDYSQDVGNSPQTFTYQAEPAPAESVAATLCNLNQTFFMGLRTESDGAAIVDDTLRTSIVGLGDLTGYLENLRVHYPDAAASIDVAGEVYQLWDEAIIDVDNGDDDAARAAMDEAERQIATLPESEAIDCVR